MVLVLVNGGIVAIDEYVSQAAAVVEAFLPALQAPTLAAALYGKVNRWGKLYSPNVVQIVKRSTQGALRSGGGWLRRPVTYYKDPLPWNLTDMAISTGVGVAIC